MSDSSGDIHEDASYKDIRTPDKPRLILKPPKSPGPTRTNKVYVAPPRLPSIQKQQYKPVNEISFAFDLETRFDEIIGEYTEGKKLFYFARHDGGIAHKVSTRIL
jgi:chromodomain-helicase-DNA-binding protein 4